MSSGIFSRCALYCGYASCRNVGPPGSIARTNLSALPFLTTETMPEASPISADVFTPVDVIRGFLKNAKCPL